MRLIQIFIISSLFIFSTSITTEHQNLVMHEGANDISFFVLPTNPSLLDIVMPIRPYVEGIQGEGWTMLPHPTIDTLWIGSVYDLIDPHDSFTIILSESAALTINGEFADPNMVYVPHLGINRISYPYNQSQSIQDAVPNEFLITIEQITWEDQAASPDATSPTGWSGNLTQINPGNGYYLYVSGEMDFYWNNPISAGDFNSDLIIDVVDIVLMVNAIISNDFSVFHLWAGDLNQDSFVNVQDLILVVNIILAS